MLIIFKGNDFEIKLGFFFSATETDGTVSGGKGLGGRGPTKSSWQSLKMAIFQLI